MNTFAKGSIAAAAGIVLLLGGAGSLAYWNAEASLQGVEVSAGELTLTAAAGAWATGLDTWVPGDEDTYRTTLTLVAGGDNIEGTVALDPAAIEDALTSQLPAGVTASEILDQFEVTLDEGAPAATVPAGAALSFAGGEYLFDGPGTYRIPVEVTVAFPYAAGVQNSSQHATIDLAEIPFLATQGDPS